MHTLPCYNWFELNKTGNLKHLLLNPGDELDDQVITAYYTLKNEYFNKFGVPADYEKHLSSMRYYGLLMAGYLASGGKQSLITHIKIAKIGLDREGDSGSFDYPKMWAAVISRMASVPDIKKFPIFDFMSIYTTLQHG